MKTVPGTSGPSLMSVRTTFAPSLANSFAASSPMPLEAPVMMHDLSFSLINPSDDLEVALQFPVGDRVRELRPFPLARADEMVHEGLAEKLPGDGRLGHPRRRLR